MRSLAEVTLAEHERRVIERLIGALEEELDLRAVWLYGSRARGDSVGADSDVDLLAITTHGWADLTEVTRILHRVAAEESADPTAFSVLVFDPDHIASRRAIHSFFMEEVDRDKVVLYGEP